MEIGLSVELLPFVLLNFSLSYLSVIQLYYVIIIIIITIVA